MGYDPKVFLKTVQNSPPPRLHYQGMVILPWKEDRDFKLYTSVKAVFDDFEVLNNTITSMFMGGFTIWVAGSTEITDLIYGEILENIPVVSSVVRYMKWTSSRNQLWETSFDRGYFDFCKERGLNAFKNKNM